MDASLAGVVQEGIIWRGSPRVGPLLFRSMGSTGRSPGLGAEKGVPRGGPLWFSCRGPLWEFDVWVPEWGIASTGAPVEDPV